MNWSNVKLVFWREVRDQLRDRRTLFMIAVLPLLLYPLMGMSFFQIAQFMREHPSKVLVIGAPRTAELPALFDGARFESSLFSDPRRAELLQLEFRESDTPLDRTEAPAQADLRAQPDPLATGRSAVVSGQFDAAICFPTEFHERLRQFRASLAASPGARVEPDPVQVPSPQIVSNHAQEKSQLAAVRVTEVLRRWMEAIGRKNLVDSRVPVAAAKPFEFVPVDVGSEDGRKLAVWAKVLPFVLIIWSLTGAFYPAVDLCAGEKERGTLETLLCSPAERIEIVWGKLLTIMVFSIATALLNLTSMGLTGVVVINQISDIGSPPLAALAWLLVALVPMSALFSALCLACAAFARSTKEGQYYLMPLVLVTLPLVILPMSPGVELSLGTALIPVTGVVLLLRTVLEGNYWGALVYLPLVTIVMLVCCQLAVRWAADQFNSESVLFRESERLDLALWCRRLLRERNPTPSVAMALACGILILLLRFFFNFAASPGSDFFTLTLLIQLVVIATPALLMSVMLTSSPRQTLLLQWPRWQALAAAVALAVFMNPVMGQIVSVVRRLYPLSDAMQSELRRMFERVGDDRFGALVALIAVAPAICEELAFRGFILSGLRHWGHKWRAIVVTSIFFGVTHMLLQQAIPAMLVGIVLGYIAVQTGSLLPCMLYHATHNALPVLLARLLADRSTAPPAWATHLVDLTTAPGDGVVFLPWVSAVSGLGVVALLAWFRHLPYVRTAEESLQETMVELDAPDSMVESELVER